MSRGRLLYHRVLLDAGGRLREIWWVEAIAGGRMRMCRRQADCTICERPEPLTAAVLTHRIDALDAEAMHWCAAHHGNAPVSEPLNDPHRSLLEAKAELDHPHRIGPPPVEFEAQRLSHRPPGLE